MTNLLITVGTMSLQASFIIGLILLLRKLFSMIGISKKYMMLLWVVPFFFLVFPWKIDTDFGFWQQAPTDYIEDYEESGNTTIFNEGNFQIVGNTIVGDVWVDGTAPENNDTTGTNSSVNSDAVANHNESDKASTMSLSDGLVVGVIIWMVGMVALFAHSVVSWMKLRKQLCFSVQENDNVYRADNIPVPMVFGIISPKIYIPSDMQYEYMEYVVEHEKTHIFRKDPLTKMVMYFIACVHWFNPLVWVAYNYMVKDMEMACDEVTLQRIGLIKKKQYATALLELSCEHTHILEFPLAFAEGDSKRRIKNVLAYRNNVMVVAVLVVLTGMLMMFFFLTKNVGAEEQNNNPQNENLEANISDTGDAEESQQISDTGAEDESEENENIDEDDTTHEGRQEDLEEEDSSNEDLTEDSSEPDYEAIVSKIAAALPQGASLGEEWLYDWGDPEISVQRDGYVCENEYQELLNRSDFLVTPGAVCFTCIDLEPSETDGGFLPILMLRGCENSYNYEQIGDVFIYEAQMLLFTCTTIGENKIPEEDWYTYFWVVCRADVEYDDLNKDWYYSTWVFLNQECFTKEEAVAIAEAISGGTK